MRLEANGLEAIAIASEKTEAVPCPVSIFHFGVCAEDESGAVGVASATPNSRVLSPPFIRAIRPSEDLELLHPSRSGSLNILPQPGEPQVGI